MSASPHKCKGVRVIYEAACECGWRSDPHYGGKFGDGGRAAAYEDWRSHKMSCLKVEEANQ